MREDIVIDPLDEWLTASFAAGHRDVTIAAIFDAQTAEGEINPSEAQLRAKIASGEAKTARYKATIDAGGDPAIVAGWISSTQAERAAAQA